MNRILYDIVDNEGSKVSVFSYEEKFWVDSEISIVRDGKLLEKKSKAIFGPYETSEDALESVPGKFSVDKISEPVSNSEVIAIEDKTEEKDDEISDKTDKS